MPRASAIALILIAAFGPASAASAQEMAMARMHHGHGHHGMKLGKHGWGGPQIKYLTGFSYDSKKSGLVSDPNGQWLDFGMDRRKQPFDWYSIGRDGGVAFQLFPGTGVGNWVAPHFGLVPRFGVNLGPLRLDVGAMGGLGAMVRTGTSDNVQARFLWLLEPQVELGFKNDWMSAGLVGSYLLTPTSDLGGASIGLRASFSAAAHEDMMGGDDEDDDDDDDDNDDDSDGEGSMDMQKEASPSAGPHEAH